jgi:hypothetical protein
MDQLQCETCQSSGKCGGATWPRYGHSRGTQSSVEWQVLKKKIGGPWVSNPRPMTEPKIWGEVHYQHVGGGVC